MKFTHTEVMNFEGAIRGMRNPLESWDKSDSIFVHFSSVKYSTKLREVAYEWTRRDLPESDINDFEFEDAFEKYCTWLYHAKGNLLGPNDFDLATRLIKSGSEHRKFLRQIFVSVDITAPLYFFKEFDTYHIGVTANSTSTMHKIHSKPITIDCFETDDLQPFEKEAMETMIDICNTYLSLYQTSKEKQYWKALIRILPESWLQTRTITMNYENIINIYKQRKNHKLTEWSESFCTWAESLPYMSDFLKYI